MQKLLRLSDQHPWALVVAHVLIVTILFVVFLSAPPIVEWAASFSRQPAELRVMVYLLALAMLAGLYIILVLFFALRQQSEARTGPRVRDALLGIWKSSDTQSGMAAPRLAVIVWQDDNTILASITAATAHGEIEAPLKITGIAGGETFLLHTERASASRRRDERSRPGLWQLELALPDGRKPFLIARAEDPAQIDAGRSPTEVILHKALGPQ
jgi:hypothetical protein